MPLYFSSVARTSSGSRSSANGVKPTRSAKRTVTSLRSGDAAAARIGVVAFSSVAAGAPKAKPQLPQKRSFGSLVVPQLGQAAASPLPHSEQKRRPGRFSVPQLLQITREQ